MSTGSGTKRQRASLAALDRAFANAEYARVRLADQGGPGAARVAEVVAVRGAAVPVLREMTLAVPAAFDGCGPGGRFVFCYPGRVYYYFLADGTSWPFTVVGGCVKAVPPAAAVRLVLETLAAQSAPARAKAVRHDP